MIASGDSPGSSTPSAAQAIPALIRPTIAPARKAASPYHHGQRGHRRAASGSSGGSGGGSGCGNA